MDPLARCEGSEDGLEEVLELMMSGEISLPVWTLGFAWGLADSGGDRFLLLMLWPS